MPIELKCEICNRVMGSYSWQKLKDIIQSKGEVCQDCVKRQEELLSFFKQTKNRYTVKFDRLLTKAQEDLSKEIKAIANKKMETEKE